MYSSEKKSYIVIVVAASLWCAAFTLQPILIHGGPLFKGASYLIGKGFAPICHQNPERCLSILNHPMAVCSRCAGIYYGALFGIFLFPWLHNQYNRLQISIRWLGFAALPILVDVGLAQAGLPSSGTVTRLFTGILLGWISMCYIIPGILDWLAPRQMKA
ncbi:DUF2085 domain-containing protein [bacterium]